MLIKGYNMVKVNNDVCTLYSKKVTFIDTGVAITQYTDTHTDYILMVANHPRLSNLSIEDIIPSKEQDIRLDRLNQLDLTNIECWSSEVSDFIEFGFINPNTPSILSTIYSEYVDSSKKYLIYKKNLILSSYRYDIEIGGILYNGLLIDTNRDTVSRLTTILSSFNLDDTKSIDYKCMNGWIKLDRNKFIEMYNIINKHISSCFTAEKIILDLLNTKTVNELLEKYNDKINDGVDVINVKILFDLEYNKLIKEI